MTAARVVPGEPLIFAVTGHRDLRPADEPRLTAAVRGVFERFRARYPHTPLALVTALAVGADRLVARAALAERIPFEAALPFPEREYRADFNALEGADFDALLARAAGYRTMTYAGDTTVRTIGEPARRAWQYARVGAYLVRVAHVVLALWDGKPSEAEGGTSAVVDYRLLGVPPELDPGPLRTDLPPTGPVYWIVAPRKSDDSPERHAGTLIVKTREGDVSEEADPFRPLYARIERENAAWRATN